jgi:MFS family permease
MPFLLGLLSGLIGLLAGWSGLAALVVLLSAPDREGGTAMGAFFNIGPIGGIIGFVAGVWLFTRLGIVRESVPSTDAALRGTASRTHVSYPFAATVLLLTAGLAYWGWYEFIRSPYLTQGFMTLQLQFRLPPGMSLLPDKANVRIEVEEGNGYAIAGLNPGWHGHDGDRQVILASASLMYKTRHRVVSLTLPDAPTETWRLDLPGDPDPMPGYSPWRLGTSPTKIEMNYRLTADH